MSTFIRIEKLLEVKGWKKAELMRRLGPDRTTYAKWVSAKRIPEKYLPRIAALLDTTEAYLRGETDDSSPNKSGAPSSQELRERERALERLNLIKPDGSLDEDRLAAIDVIVKSIDSVTRKRE